MSITEQGMSEFTYSMVARDGVVVSEYEQKDGFKRLAVFSLGILPTTGNHKLTCNFEGHTYIYMVEERMTYAVVAVDHIGTSAPNFFLLRIKEEFMKHCGGMTAEEIATIFSPKLKEHMQYQATEVKGETMQKENEKPISKSEVSNRKSYQQVEKDFGGKLDYLKQFGAVFGDLDNFVRDQPALDHKKRKADWNTIQEEIHQTATEVMKLLRKTDKESCEKRQKLRSEKLELQSQAKGQCVLDNTAIFCETNDWIRSKAKFDLHRLPRRHAKKILKFRMVLATITKSDHIFEVITGKGTDGHTCYIREQTLAILKKNGINVTHSKSGKKDNEGSVLFFLPWNKKLILSPDSPIAPTPTPAPAPAPAPASPIPPPPPLTAPTPTRTPIPPPEFRKGG